MRAQLHVTTNDNIADYSNGKRFRFAVVDLDRAEVYPANFVCLLPMQLGLNRKGLNVFVRIFGDRSLEVAKGLLLKALERETDSEVKRQIEGRLKLLEPKPINQTKCDACGQLFQAKPKKGFKQKFCPECLKKKFANRA